MPSLKDSEYESNWISNGPVLDCERTVLFSACTRAGAGAGPGARPGARPCRGLGPSYRCAHQDRKSNQCRTHSTLPGVQPKVISNVFS